jgi:hypothetical protein
MRLQRRLDRFLARFADQQSTLYQSLQMPTAVIPVVTVGHDHADDERATFWSGDNLAGVGAQFGTYRLDAITGDIEVLWAMLASPGGVLQAELADAVHGLTAITNQPNFSYTAAALSHGQVRAANEAGLVGFRVGQALQNVTLELPVAGMVLERGRSLVMQSFTANLATVGSFGWRNVQGNP